MHLSLPEIVTFKKYNCLLLPGNGWAQGSFIEAEAEVEAEARQGSNVLNRGEARQIRQRARGRGEAD